MEKFEKNSLLANYEQRYCSDEHGENTYRASGKKRLIGTENDIYYEAIASRLPTASATKNLSILDFGCGDGRVLEALANGIRNYIPQDIIIHLIGYDIVPAGLEALKRRLLLTGYVDSSAIHTNKQSPANVLRHEKNNIIVTLILGDIETAPDQMINTITSGKSMDVSIAAFGVMAHMIDDPTLDRDKQQRVAWMRAIGDVTQGDVIISISTPLEYQEELAANCKPPTYNDEPLPAYTFFYADAHDGVMKQDAPLIPWQCLSVDEARLQAEDAWKKQNAPIHLSVCNLINTGPANTPCSKFLNCLRNDDIDMVNTNLSGALNARLLNGNASLAELKDNAGFIFLIRGARI